jgi:fatty-acyl-CoA synthase
MTGVTVPFSPLEVDAPFTLGAQLDARAAHPELASRPFAVHDDRSWTYAEFRAESVRVAEFLLGRLGRPSPSAPGHVAMLLENHLELLGLYAGCGYAGMTLFGINTGLVGEPLAGVVNQSRARLLVVDEKLVDRVEAVLGSLEHVSERDILVVPSREGATVAMGERLDDALERECGPAAADRPTPKAEVEPDTNLMVIYTSGTTGLPKGINNNHAKLLIIGRTVSGNLELSPEDRGYACMPLFHSNAIFLGVMPGFVAGGSIGLRERFSASRFVPDVLDYGVTYWNYVGEPVHYILAAIESAAGGDAERIRADVTDHPRNRLRYAVGNGASPPDLDRFVEWLGLEDMFELYGSTEAAISTFRKKTDPRGSVGEIGDPAVRILAEDGRECPPAELDADGRIANYAEAVGEICRVADDTALFQGYFDNDDANQSKYRDGVYHSGDLGHVLERDGRRYLFFDGRTDDWIRKDGENFSGAQVARLASEHPDVVLAAAYGVPCAVSDELVMVALKMAPDADFDPDRFFEYCEQQTEHGGMDRKWFPDFVRVVDDFEYTQTEKILVRNLKKQHFHPDRVGGSPVWWRERGSTTYARFTPEDFRTLRARFAAAERADLLER